MNKYILIVIILFTGEFFIFLQRKIEIIENSQMEKILKTRKLATLSFNTLIKTIERKENIDIITA